MARVRRAFAVGVSLLAACAGATPSPKGVVGAPGAGAEPGGEVDGCPAEMARIGTFCVDRYEATVVTVEGGKERPRSPYQTVGDASVRARSAPNVVPQAYISQVQAPAACAVSCWDRREERGPRNKEQGLRSGDRGTRNKD